MAKRIKFPLEMKDGIKVRTLEELRLHFDVEKVLLYYMNGKLLSWLLDRHYDEYIAEFKKIKRTDNSLLEICRILDIKDVDAGNIDVRKIEQKNNKILKVKQYTDRKEVLDNIDLVAMNQKEFEALVKAEEKVIYLCGSEFVCPLSVENVTIEGIDNPKIVIDTTEIIDFEAKNVVLKNLIFDETYQSLLAQQQYEKEHGNDKKNIAYQASSLFDIRLNDKDRKKSQRLYERLQKELIDIVFDVDVYTNKMEKMLQDADLYDAFDIDIIGKEQRDCLENANLDDIFYEFCNRIRE